MDRDGQALPEFISALKRDPDKEQVATEIEALQSIYGDDNVNLWNNQSDDIHVMNGADHIRFEVVSRSNRRYPISLW